MNLRRRTFPLLLSLFLAFSLPAASQSELPPDTKAPPPGNAEAGEKQEKAKKETASAANRASAYYHYTVAHMYEELVAIYGRSEFANKAIEEYRLAIENDPESEYLTAGLAELYAKTGRIRDAVLEAEDILKRDPDNVEARKLLGRIYLRSLGDMQSGTQSREILRRAINQFEHISRVEPSDTDNLLLLGRLYRLNNELLKAEEAFRRAVELDPESEEAVTSLAILYGEEGDIEKAIQTLESVPEAARTSKIYSAMGLTYEQQRQYNDAIRAYRKALEMEEDNLDARRGLAQNLFSAGLSGEALEEYRAIAEADPQDAQAQLRLAEILRRRGEFDQALAHLNRAETLVPPGSVEVPFNKVLVYEAQGRWDAAVRILQELLERTAKPADAYNAGERNNRAVFLERLGSIYRDTRQTEKALDAFREVVALGGEQAARGYQQLIETHRQARQWQESLEVARQAVEQFPQDRSMRLVLASLKADLGKDEEALADVRGMLQGNAEDRQVYVALAQINSRLKRWPEAEAAIAKAQEFSAEQGEKDFALFLEASIYERQQKYDEAEKLFRELLSREPDNAMVLNYLGYMNADRGVKLQESLRLIEKAVEQEPQNAAYLDSLGWAHFRLGNLERAEEFLRQAIEREPGDPTIHDHLGDVYLERGRLKLAAAHFERALEEWRQLLPADVDAVEVAKVQKKLENVKVKLARQGK